MKYSLVELVISIIVGVMIMIVTLWLSLLWSFGETIDFLEITVGQGRTFAIMLGIIIQFLPTLLLVYQKQNMAMANSLNKTAKNKSRIEEYIKLAVKFQIMFWVVTVLDMFTNTGEIFFSEFSADSTLKMAFNLFLSFPFQQQVNIVVKFTVAILVVYAEEFFAILASSLLGDLKGLYALYDLTPPGWLDGLKEHTNLPTGFER